MKPVTDELVWFNGKVMPLAQAKVGLEDRGFNFADGIYEVVRFYRGKTFTLAEHLQRLVRSAQAIQLIVPADIEDLARDVRQLIIDTGIKEGMVYLQLTRGEAPRAHAFPEKSRPTLFFYARPLPEPWKPGRGEGCRLLSAVDDRWQKCWIKSLALLPNVLAKNHALSTGHDEAVFIHEGKVTECSASNIFCVRGGKVITAPVGPKVLPGITRLVILKLAKKLGIPVEEKAVGRDEAVACDEVFISSTTRELNWVREWDGTTIDAGKCGPITRTLHEAFVAEVKAETK